MKRESFLAQACNAYLVLEIFRRGIDRQITHWAMQMRCSLLVSQVQTEKHLTPLKVSHEISRVACESERDTFSFTEL